MNGIFIAILTLHSAIFSISTSQVAERLQVPKISPIYIRAIFFRSRDKQKRNKGKKKTIIHGEW